MADSRWLQLLTTILGPPSGSAATWGVQELEDTFDDLLLGRAIGTAAGRQLEGIGEILGLGRTSTDDEEYRDDLRIQAAINNSHGLAEELIAIASRLRGVTATRLTELPPAGFALAVVTPTMPGPWARTGLHRSHAGGVRCRIVTAPLNPFVVGNTVDAAGVASVVGDPTVGHGLGWEFTVAGIVAGAPGIGYVRIAGDKTALFTAGETLHVLGSTSNDGWYTVASSALVAGDTRVYVAETLGAVGVALGVANFGQAATSGHLAWSWAP